ncbi:MAG: nucleotidyl transferase AbiEii/AbiGii toxin family protein [Bacteroidota bacterium]
MLNLEQIVNYFPPYINENPSFRKYMVKEYIQLLILDFLSNSRWVKKLVFIGGTNLRIVKGLDRFSEDIDFDCKNLTDEEFRRITQEVVSYLKRFGFNVEEREHTGQKLSAFRSNLVFPGTLFDLGISSHKEEKFLIKIECQDQGINYSSFVANIKGCGIFCVFPVPVDPVLCAMKISALLNRSKGRDFYDAIFLLGHAEPDFNFLSEKCNIHNYDELKTALVNLVKSIDLKHKAKDFEHLLFNKLNNRRVINFSEFVNSM